MIAEIEGGAVAVDIINTLRDTHDLPHFASTDANEIRAQVLEERRRELFLQGTKMGDDLRTGEWQDWDTGVSPVNAPIGDNTCIPIPDIEFL